MLLPVKPNWANEVQTTREYLTEIFTSHDGSEQRVAWRQAPRRRTSFTTWLKSGTRPLMDSARRHNRDARDTMVDVSEEGSRITQINDADTIRVDRVFLWAKPGQAVSFYSRGVLTDPIFINSTTNQTISFTTILPAGIAVGDIACPIFDVDFRNTSTFTFETSDFATSRIEASISPGQEDAPESDTGDMFDGREVWLKRPNWTSAPQFQFDNTTIFNDTGYGVVGRQNPISLNVPKMQASTFYRSRIEIRELVDFFDRQKGRRGEFFVPSWVSDLHLSADISNGDTHIDTTLDDLEDLYGDLEAFRAIALDTTTHGVLLRKIDNISGNRINLTSSLPALPRAAVPMVSWLPLCRFASDLLTITWDTATTASALLNYQTLRYVAAD